MAGGPRPLSSTAVCYSSVRFTPICYSLVLSHFTAQTVLEGKRGKTTKFNIESKLLFIKKKKSTRISDLLDPADFKNSILFFISFFFFFCRLNTFSANGQEKIIRGDEVTQPPPCYWWLVELAYNIKAASPLFVVGHGKCRWVLSAHLITSSGQLGRLSHW